MRLVEDDDDDDKYGVGDDYDDGDEVYITWCDYDVVHGGWWWRI